LIPRRELFALGDGIEGPFLCDREEKLSDEEGDKSRRWRTRSLATSYFFGTATFFSVRKRPLFTEGFKIPCSLFTSNSTFSLFSIFAFQVFLLKL